MGEVSMSERREATTSPTSRPHRTREGGGGSPAHVCAGHVDAAQSEGHLQRRRSCLTSGDC